MSGGLSSKRSGEKGYSDQPRLSIEERFRQLKIQLKEQKRVCKEVLRSNDLVSAGEKIQKLEETYQKWQIQGSVFESNYHP